MVQDYMWLGWWKWDRRQIKDVINVYPAWIWAGPYSWHQVENIDFIDSMLREVTDSLCVDKSELHIVGHSLGAYFSNKLSCLRWDIVSSMTAVAGPWYDSDCSWPVKSLIMHNKADRLVPYSDWERALNIRKKVNECSENTESVKIEWYSCTKRSCSKSNPVLFCWEYKTYWDVPHSWPTSWNKLIFNFFDYK